MKVGVTPDAGPAYILNPQRQLVLRGAGGADNTLSTAFSPSQTRYDTPVNAAVGYPAFGTLDGSNVDFFAPGDRSVPGRSTCRAGIPGRSGLHRRLEPAAADRRVPPRLPRPRQRPAVPHRAGGGPDPRPRRSAGDRGHVLARPGGIWSQRRGREPGMAEIDRRLDCRDPDAGLVRARSTPSPSARKDVVSITRSGDALRLPDSGARPARRAPRRAFITTIANSGDYTRDAVPPGAPMDGRIRLSTLSFIAPGNDLLCGRASAYQLVTSRRPITAQRFASARRLAVDLRPVTGGLRASSSTLPRGLLAYIAIRAVDGAGNVGRPMVLKVPR